MSKRQSLMVIGVWIIILPFLGFPSEWEKILVAITGAIVILAAYRLNSETVSSRSGASSSAPYVEHRSSAAPAATIPPIVPAPSEPAITPPPVTNPDNIQTP